MFLSECIFIKNALHVEIAKLRSCVMQKFSMTSNAFKLILCLQTCLTPVDIVLVLLLHNKLPLNHTNLKQHTFITSYLVWAGDPGMALLHPLTSGSLRGCNEVWAELWPSYDSKSGAGGGGVGSASTLM